MKKLYSQPIINRFDLIACNILDVSPLININNDQDDPFTTNALDSNGLGG